jgi:hypothetical protein
MVRSGALHPSPLDRRSTPASLRARTRPKAWTPHHPDPKRPPQTKQRRDGDGFRVAAEQPATRLIRANTTQLAQGFFGRHGFVAEQVVTGGYGAGAIRALFCYVSL